MRLAALMLPLTLLVSGQATAGILDDNSQKFGPKEDFAAVQGAATLDHSSVWLLRGSDGYRRKTSRRAGAVHGVGVNKMSFLLVVGGQSLETSSGTTSSTVS